MDNLILNMMQKMTITLSIMFLSLYAISQQKRTDSAESPKQQALGKEKAQIIIEDPYRLEYKDVYENMHYNQPLRPQVHYTPITGQIADATGLVRYKGKYHLFYMFDEWSKQRRDNKNWGHAVSEDCIYWEQQPPITNAIIDNRPGSGSGIVDWNNTLGLRQGVEKLLVVFYTDYGRGICISYSPDAGKTWIRHKNNPVLPAKENMRDPNVFWYTPDQSWRMVIYEQTGFSFYSSNDLLHWKFLSHMEGFFECPDLLQMPVDGNKEMEKWVLIDGNGAYYIGDFNGSSFVPESTKLPLGQETFLNNSGGRPHFYTKDIYATQTWKNSYEGDGPFYQLAFMMIKNAPTHPRTWSQQMIFPVELTLKTINHELRLCRNPIDGIKQLRYDPHYWKDISLTATTNPFDTIKGDVFEVIAAIETGTAKEVVFEIRGEKLRYRSAEKQLLFMGDTIPVHTRNNLIQLRCIIDRNSVEIYANEGEATFTRLFYPDFSNKNLSLSSTGGEGYIKNIALYRLESIWLKREQELGYKR